MKIDFAGPAACVAALGSIDKPLGREAVGLEPTLPWSWRWEDDRTLVFTLTGGWPADGVLHVTIHPAALSLAVHLSANQLETCTPATDVRFSQAEFYQNPKDPAVRQVTATILKPLRRRPGRTRSARRTRAREFCGVASKHLTVNSRTHFGSYPQKV